MSTPAPAWKRSQTRGFWFTFCVAINLVMFIALWANPWIGQQGSLFCDLVTSIVPVSTLPLIVSALRSKRKVAVLLGGSTLVIVAGLFISIIQRYSFGVYTSPSWLDYASMVYYPMLIIALLGWPSRQEHPGHRTRNALDVIVVAAGLWAFVWFFVFGPVVVYHHERLVKTLAEVFVPTCDLLLVVALFQFVRRGSDERFREPVLAFVPGLLVLVTFDLSFELLMLHTDRMPSTLAAIKWSLVSTLMSLAGYLFAQRARETASQPTPVSDPLERALSVQPWYSLLPYAFIPVVASLLLYSDPRNPTRPFAGGVIFGGLVMIFGLIFRQILTLKENATLLTELQKSYKEVTAKSSELKRTNKELEVTMGRLAENNNELNRANMQLAQLVTIDGMTGLENHRSFHQRLRLEVEAAKRHRHSLSLIMADVDYFKRYNDEFGHPAGDEVLRQIAKVFMDQLGERAYPARYGGEEFAVILPYLSATEALNVAERLGRAVSTRAGATRRISMSFGVATLEPGSGAERLVAEADRALYASKTWGRNRTVHVSDLDRRRLSLAVGGDQAEFDPNEPMGLAAILSAGLRGHAQALSIESDSQLVGGLLTTLEIKDVETRDHSERVMWYAMRLAQSVIETGVATMTFQDMRALAYGALLHDIGKIGVPEQILKHTGPLSPEMREVINEHPGHGAQIVQKFPSLDMALAVIHNHHERWDGKGYPNGLKGTEIPLVARIFSVVDALEAMTSKRPYKEPLPFEYVVPRLKEGEGTMYDPEILAAFLAVSAEEWQSIRNFETKVTRTIGEFGAAVA